MMALLTSLSTYFGIKAPLDKIMCHFAPVDQQSWPSLIGKGGHVRTIPVPDWVKSGIDAWMAATGISESEANLHR
jgi:hypothetical protein